MAKPQRLRIRETVYEDGAGVVYRAKDASGQKVLLRKPKSVDKTLGPAEQVAYQVVIERLGGIHHPSLLPVASGGIDADDGLPYIATRPETAESLQDRLRQRPLSIELTTTLLSQALEVSELLSHFLADDGVWIETTPQSILATEKFLEPRFVFWPNPIKALGKGGKANGFQGLIQLTEQALGWSGREVDEREGGHLQMWLKWLKDSGGNVAVREAREMLAAAAGVEPPGPLETLVEESCRKPGRLDGLPKLGTLMRWQAPKMPLLALLSVMLVVQSIVGWFIMRKINENIDEELQKLNSGYTATPYTIDRDPSRKAERGSQPLKFD